MSHIIWLTPHILTMWVSDASSVFRFWKVLKYSSLLGDCTFFRFSLLVQDSLHMYCALTRKWTDSVKVVSVSVQVLTAYSSICLYQRLLWLTNDRPLYCSLSSAVDTITQHNNLKSSIMAAVHESLHCKWVVDLHILATYTLILLLAL